MARARSYLRSRPERPLSLGRIDKLVTAKLRAVDILLRGTFYEVTEQAHLREGVISSLAIIATNPGISQNEIGAQLTIDRTTIVAVIDTLEKLGWAERRKSKEDRRRHSLQATPEGEAQLNRLVDAVEKIEEEMLAMVPKEDLDQLLQILDRMHASCIRYVRARES